MQVKELKSYDTRRAGRFNRSTEHTSITDRSNAGNVIDDSRAVLQDIKKWHANIDPAKRRRWRIGAFVAGTVAVCAALKYGHEFNDMPGMKLTLFPSNRPWGYLKAVARGTKNIIGSGGIDARTCAHLTTLNWEDMGKGNNNQRRLPAGIFTLGLLAAHTLYTVEQPEPIQAPTVHIAPEARINSVHPLYAHNKIGTLVTGPMPQFTATTIPDMTVGQQTPPTYTLNRNSTTSPGCIT